VAAQDTESQQQQRARTTHHAESPHHLNNKQTTSGTSSVKSCKSEGRASDNVGHSTAQCVRPLRSFVRLVVEFDRIQNSFVRFVRSFASFVRSLRSFTSLIKSLRFVRCRSFVGHHRDVTSRCGWECYGDEPTLRCRWVVAWVVVVCS